MHAKIIIYLLYFLFIETQGWLSQWFYTIVIL